MKCTCFFVRHIPILCEWGASGPWTTRCSGLVFCGRLSCSIRTSFWPASARSAKRVAFGPADCRYTPLCSPQAFLRSPYTFSGYRKVARDQRPPGFSLRQHFRVVRSGLHLSARLQNLKGSRGRFFLELLRAQPPVAAPHVAAERLLTHRFWRKRDRRSHHRQLGRLGLAAGWSLHDWPPSSASRTPSLPVLAHSATSWRSLWSSSSPTGSAPGANMTFTNSRNRSPYAS